MAIGLFFFGANIVALTANLLTGAGLLISNPRSFNARIFPGVTVSLACYAVGRLSYAVPADVQVSTSIWPSLSREIRLAPTVRARMAERSLTSCGRKVGSTSRSRPVVTTRLDRRGRSPISVMATASAAPISAIADHLFQSTLLI